MTWEMVPLKDIGTWYGGGTPSKSNPDFWHDGTVPWLSPKDMGDDVLSGTKDRITEAAVSGSSVKRVPANSVAVVVRSGILEHTLPVALVPFETTLNQDMKAIVADPGVDPRWLAWGLKAYEHTILQTCRKTGTTVASIDTKRLHEFRLPVPSIDEQRRILDQIQENFIATNSATATVKYNRTRIQALSRQLIQTEIAGYGLGEERKPWTLPDIGLHDGLLPNIPASWSTARLGDVAEVVGGVTKDVKKQSRPDNVVRPYLRVANVQRGRLDLKNVTEIGVPEKKAVQLELQVGDVLLNEGGDRDKLARGWVWEGQLPQCIHQNHVFRARVQDDAVDPYFLSFLANTIGGTWAERNGKQSVNLASISLSKIKQMPVVVPPLEEGRRIAQELVGQLDELDRLDQMLQRALNRSESLRRSILNAAFEGRLTEQRSHSVVVPDITAPEQPAFIPRNALTWLACM